MYNLCSVEYKVGLQRVKALIEVLCKKCEETYKIETKGSSGKGEDKELSEKDVI